MERDANQQDVVNLRVVRAPRSGKSSSESIKPTGHINGGTPGGTPRWYPQLSKLWPLGTTSSQLSSPRPIRPSSSCVRSDVVCRSSDTCSHPFGDTNGDVSITCVVSLWAVPSLMVSICWYQVCYHQIPMMLINHVETYDELHQSLKSNDFHIGKRLLPAVPSPTALRGGAAPKLASSWYHHFVRRGMLYRLIPV